MRTAKKVLLAGIATVALAGGAGLALAGSPQSHTMTVALPDGGTATIQYTGKIAPKVTLDSSPFHAAFFAPVWPFATLNQVAARMDGRMNAILHEADTLALPVWNSNKLLEADVRNSPAGITSYSFVSTMTGKGVCTRATEFTSNGKGAQPEVVTHISGHCGPLDHATLASPFTWRADAGQAAAPVNAIRNAQAGPAVSQVAYHSFR